MTRMIVQPTRTYPIWSSVNNDPFLNEALSWVFGSPRRTATGNGSAQYNLRFNLYQDNENFYLYSLLPGVDASQLEITTLENKLTISGEINSETVAPQGEGVEVLRRELTTEAVKFSREVEFPATIDAEKVSANFENGVLKLTLPKAPQAKARRVNIQ